MDNKRLDKVLAPYNPWWRKADWDSKLPEYQRPVVNEILSDLRELSQIVSVTGPRRIGKSTALQHVVSRLIRDQGIDPGRIVYFSLDDPEIYASDEARRVVLDLLFDRYAERGDSSYVLLDEIQRLPRWELFLKKLTTLKGLCVF